MKQYIIRGVQLFLAGIVLIFSITRFGYNHIGQNIINFTTVAIFAVGWDNLIMAYRSYINKQSFQFEATFIIFCLLFLAVLFQKFNRSPQYNDYFNSACYIIDLLVVILNLIYLAGILLTLGIYCIRQIYRLMTETLLTNAANLQRHQIQNILRQKKPYYEIIRQKPGVNTQCTICFLDFQRNNICLMLPGCQHCFHDECIQKWLVQKSTCPNCRSNLRLNIV